MQCFIKRNQSSQTYHLYLSLTQGTVLLLHMVIVSNSSTHCVFFKCKLCNACLFCLTLCLQCSSILLYMSALADDGKFLLAARKYRRTTCTDYIISLQVDDMSKGSGTYIGKLRCVVINSLFKLSCQQSLKLNLDLVGIVY